MFTRRSFRLGTVFAFLAALLCTASLSWAQLSTTATITGTVTDASGAIVPGATVTILNQDTNVPRTTESNADGSFVMPGLAVGTYTVTVTKTGFQTFSENGIILHPTLVATVNPSLKVGGVATTVTVAANAAQVQTATPEVSSQVSQMQVETLPLNGRNYQSLSALMPGITNYNPDTAMTGFGNTGNVLSVNGMGTSGTLYTLDGIWNMNTGSMGSSNIVPNPDTISEVRVLQNVYGVQYSLMGENVVMIQTKSGTDQFHGTAYEYVRNDALNARNFFSPTVPAYKQNVFGYTVGGPLFIPNHYNTDKQKTFFFWSQQWYDQHVASAVTGATPTAAERQGTFPTSITNPATKQPFPTANGGFQIPSTSINADALALLNAMNPLPNNTAGGFNNYINLTPQLNNERDDEIKIDHNINQRLRLMGEYLDAHQTEIVPYALSTVFSTAKDPSTYVGQLAQIQLTQVLSHSMVNTTSVGMNNLVSWIGISGTYLRSQLSSFNETLPYPNAFLSNRLPFVTFSGGYSSMGVYQEEPLLHNSDLEDTAADDWSWLHGNHYIQAGVNIVLGTKRQNAFSQTNGQWGFTGIYTGNSIADYLLGDAATFVQANNEPRGYGHYHVLSPYVQDRWKVSRRLTVTAGLRYSFMPVPQGQKAFDGEFNSALYNPAQVPIVNANGTITPTANYNPNNGIEVNGVNGVPLNFTTAHQNYYGPTAGFAWDVFGDGKTALRGGYGLTFTRTPFASDCSYYCSENYPFVATLSLVTPSFPNPIGAATAPTAAPAMGYGMFLNNQQASQVHTYSLSLERTVGSWFFSIAGAGDAAHHLDGKWNINQPYPDAPYNFNPAINSGTESQNVFAPYQGFGNIMTTATQMNNYWNALEFSLRHPVGKNLFLSSSYTWQHGLTNERGTGLNQQAANTQDVYHPGNSYGSANINSPQIFTLSLVYRLPWYQQAKGIAALALGGWQFSDITTIQTGFSLDPGLSIAHQGLATLPNRLANTHVLGPKLRQQWFNTAAFAAPAAGYFGDAAPGSITGPGVVNFDMAFYKDFHIAENYTLEFRSELFNIFNIANFNGVSAALGSGSYGTVTSARDPRIAEFALRFKF